MVLTGKPGTGKSTSLQYLLEWLRQHNYSTSYAFPSMMPSVDLLELILQDFGIASPSRSMSNLLTALHAWLLNRYKLGDCPVMIIDEAQALSTRALGELRMLLNLQGPSGKLVQLVLAG
jgi:general secretion pathway protein A